MHTIESLNIGNSFDSIASKLNLKLYLKATLCQRVRCKSVPPSQSRTRTELVIVTLPINIFQLSRYYFTRPLEPLNIFQVVSAFNWNCSKVGIEQSGSIRGRANWVRALVQPKVEVSRAQAPGDRIPAKQIGESHLILSN